MKTKKVFGVEVPAGDADRVRRIALELFGMTTTVVAAAEARNVAAVNAWNACKTVRAYRTPTCCGQIIGYDVSPIMCRKSFWAQRTTPNPTRIYGARCFRGKP